MEKLLELAKKTPAELWTLYPERVRYEEKIVVETEKSNTNPELVLEQLVKFIQIFKRKPYLLDRICRKIVKELEK